MNKKIISFIKYNKFFLGIYRFFGNAFLCFLKLFVRVNKKKILFMSFGGQKYDDSPKALYEKMKVDPFFKDYKMIWAFTNPAAHSVDCKKVKTDTLKFYITALSCGIWINNSSIERGLKLKRSKTLEINTWHGTPLKKMGADIQNYQGYKSKKSKGRTVYCAQSEYDKEIFTRLFNTEKENIIVTDLPRNDSLTSYSENDKNAIKEKLGLPKDKKIILYAPTFREYDRDKYNACYINPPITLQKWREKLGNDYVLLFRAHYEVINVLGIQDDGFVFNVSKYPFLNDLMAISDILISDYSSIYFDYAITGKPMLNFSYDLDAYEKFRGLYLDLNEVMPCNVNLTEDTLLDELTTFNESEYCKKTVAFKERFAPLAGNASELVIEKLKTILI